MKIAYDHQVFIHQRYGGISRYFIEIARHLSANDTDDVRIAALLHQNEYLSTLHGPTIHGLQIPRLPALVELSLGLDAMLASSLRYVWPAPDVFHETYYSRLDFCPPSAARVVTVHDLIDEKFRSADRKFDGVRKAKRMAVGRADHVIAVSANTKADLIDLLSVPEQKISVVHHGTSLTSTTAPRTPRVPAPPFLLFVGERAGYKNFEALLQACAASPILRDLRIVCFGGGPLMSAEYALAKQLGLSTDRLHAVGGGDTELAATYKAASALVYPSLYEGFGMPPLEAMSLGCPVVCCGSSSLPEVVGDAAVLLGSCDPDEIGAAVERVLTDELLRARLIDKGRARANLFTWERCAEETRTAYEYALAHSG